MTDNSDVLHFYAESDDWLDGLLAGFRKRRESRSPATTEEIADLLLATMEHMPSEHQAAMLALVLGTAVQRLI